MTSRSHWAQRDFDIAIAVEFSEIISVEAAIRMVDGCTEKVGGVNPSRFLVGGPRKGREYRLGMIPLECFIDNEQGALYDATVSLSRAQSYARRPNDAIPPVIATQGRHSDDLRIVDGGHRISAARMRGDLSIFSIIEVEVLTPVERPRCR